MTVTNLPPSGFSKDMLEGVVSDTCIRRVLVLKYHCAERRGDALCKIEDFAHLDLLPYHRIILERELGFWHQSYLPIRSDVLDLGAGSGETCQFYLNHGAKKVICVEADSEAVLRLRSNFGGDSRVVGEEGMILETHFPMRMRKLHIPWRTSIRLWRIERRGWIGCLVYGRPFSENLRRFIRRRFKSAPNR